ncbi:very short patch repair endonuclease [Dactylosporangium sp. NPDC048998]|uniref:very short patch repair endonuclease n=1 Tax=Dactylosporangium sp. NPDC048998 TaxID=3363976 RepID=UPI0037194BCE
MVGWRSTAEGRHLKGRRKADTGPEIMLRRALHALGARFRLHRHIARGCTPDLVLPGRRIAVFVDGDYWHSCPAHGRRTPFVGPNAQLWTEKMRHNRERDARSTRLAEQAGWQVVRVWECRIRQDAVNAAKATLEGRTLGPADWPPPGQPSATDLPP